MPLFQVKGMLMPLDWTPLVKLVHGSRRLLLTTHVRPDADGLGSQLALAEVLRDLGKEVRPIIASKFPPRYDFLDPDKRIERFEPPGERWRNVDAVIVLDTGTWNQLGDFGPFLKELAVPKLVIDHHLSQDDLGAVRLVDTTAEATGRLVYEAIDALGVPLPESAANHLFAALAMDTGWFRHPNTTPATFALAEQLVRAGARPTILYEHLFENSTLPRLKLTGLVLDRLQVCEGGLVAHTEIRREDYAATGATPQDTEDLVNFTRSLSGVEVGLFFMEQPRGGVKISFRARSRVDVAKIAEQFGGGGHRLASGAIAEGSLADVRVKVLEAVHRALPSI
jgi:phosphoesterase RecJ-like protein